MRFIKLLYILYLKITNLSCSIRASEVGKNVKLGKKVTLSNGTFVFGKKIGSYTYVNRFTIIDKNVKSIGKFCSIAVNCRIGQGAHPMDWVSTHSFTYNKVYNFIKNDIKNNKFQDDLETIIGNDVWIGSNATILAGITIGDGAIIGAHSLVNKDVEPYSVVVGAPAKHLKYRHSKEHRTMLLKAQWWNWSKEKIKSNIDAFRNIEDFKNILS